MQRSWQHLNLHIPTFRRKIYPIEMLVSTNKFGWRYNPACRQRQIHEVYKYHHLSGPDVILGTNLHVLRRWTEEKYEFELLLLARYRIIKHKFHKFLHWTLTWAKTSCTAPYFFKTNFIILRFISVSLNWCFPFTDKMFVYSIPKQMDWP